MIHLVSLAVVVLAVFGIVRKYKPHTVLLAAGMLLMTVAIATGRSILPAAESTGVPLFDVFEFISRLLSRRTAELGLMIMAAAGFASYIGKIQAGEALVHLLGRPLHSIKSTYVVLALVYVLGQVLNIFIPSAAGLGMLLMATFFPALIAMGVSRLSAAAVIATTACLDLGPGSGNAILAARTAGLDTVVYFVQYQIVICLPVMAAIALLHGWTQRRGDRKNPAEANPVCADSADPAPAALPDAPRIYALLPVMPLLLLLLFNPMSHRFTTALFGCPVELNVLTAILMGVFVTVGFEAVRYRSLKKAFSGIQNFFDGMGKMFAQVVTLIVAGETFAHGLKSVGAVDVLIHTAQGRSWNTPILSGVVMLIISISAIVMGSGNAVFFAFAPVMPDVAQQLGAPVLELILPMQLAAGIARSFSPITGVVVAVAGAAGISPFILIKRTAVPMIGGLLVLWISNSLFFYLM